jgi:hypothetical protein
MASSRAANSTGLIRCAQKPASPTLQNIDLPSVTAERHARQEKFRFSSRMRPQVLHRGHHPSLPGRLGTQRGARRKSSRTPRLRRVPSETKEDSWFQKPFRAKHATARFNSAGKAADNTLAPPNFASPSRGAPFESSLIGFDNAARVKEFRLTQTRSD